MHEAKRIVIIGSVSGSSQILTSATTATSLMSQTEYTVIASGERFTFTKEQLESDPENYFAAYFLGDADGTNEMTLQVEPLLFRIIQAHLRGYVALPIPDACIPPYMTRANALQNLLRDVDLFHLNRLKLLVMEEIKPQYRYMSSLKYQQRFQLRIHPSKKSQAFTDVRTIPIFPEIADQYIASKAIRPPACDNCIKPEEGWKFVTCLSGGQGMYDQYYHTVLEAKEV